MQNIPITKIKTKNEAKQTDAVTVKQYQGSSDN